MPSNQVKDVGDGITTCYPLIIQQIMLVTFIDEIGMKKPIKDRNFLERNGRLE